MPTTLRAGATTERRSPGTEISTRIGAQAATPVTPSALGLRNISRASYEFTARDFEVRSRSGSTPRRPGYRHSFHELRHFFATVGASEVALASLPKVLGHKRRATTSDIYGHLYEPDARKVTNAVEKVLRADDTA